MGDQSTISKRPQMTENIGDTSDSVPMNNDTKCIKGRRKVGKRPSTKSHLLSVKTTILQTRIRNKPKIDRVPKEYHVAGSSTDLTT